MVKVLSPSNHRDVNRMDLTTHQSYEQHSYEPMMVQSEMTQMDPSQFLPEMEKKYSHPPYVYKHVYVTSPEVSTKPVEKKRKKKKVQEKDDSWMEYLNPFSCDDEYDSSDDYTYYYGSEEQLTKKKGKVKPKKKKKKLIVKFLIAAALLFAAKCIITQLYYYFPTFFPTTGRDELYQDDEDQLFHDGIDIDRAGDHGKAQELARSYQSVFSPQFDETKIAHTLIEKIGNFVRRK